MGAERYRIAPLGVADDFTDGLMSFAEALQAAQDHKVETELGSEGKSKGQLTVADVIADYVTWMEAHRASAHDTKCRAALHIVPELGKIRVVDLTTTMIKNWRDSLITKPGQWRPSKDGKKHLRPMPTDADAKRARKNNANRIFTILKAALNHAFRDGRIETDAAWRRVTRFAKVEAARERALTVEEAQRLINAADPETGFRDVVHAALQTGCRYGELMALRVEDFSNGKIAIRKSKSGKPRHVRLTAEGRAFFEALTMGRAPGEIMLLNRRHDRGPRDWHKADQARPMRDACDVARIDPPIGIHQLRHTYASLAVMNGTPLIVVANNLGHRDTTMVEKHYGHLTTNYMDEAIEAGAPRFGLVPSSNVKPMRR
jgi:integrase